jgi:hypothetical protein
MGVSAVPNSDGKGGFSKGKSGNPAGRPRGKRSLANTLLDASERKDFCPLTNGQMLSRHIWQGLLFGEIDMGRDRAYKLTAREWMDLVKWTHQHVDGTVNFGVRAEAMEPEPEEVPEPEERQYILKEPIQYTYEQGMALEAGLQRQREWDEEEASLKKRGGGRSDWD